MRTTAALSTGPQSDFVLEDVELSEPHEDEILVRLVAAGICHTDLTTKAMFPIERPAIFGHEGAGVVEQVGSGVADIAVGDHVVLSYNSCGQCARCTSGNRAYCVQFPALNVGGARPDGTPTVTQDGAPVWASFFGQSSFAQHAIANKQNAVVVPADLDLAELAPLGCGFQTGAGAVANVLAPTAGSSVVVYGAGGVGMAGIMAAKALGVETIIAVELSEARREKALKVGATHAFDGSAQDIVEQVVAATGGGASHALDTTAVPAVIRNAVLALGNHGQLVVVGIGQPDIDINVSDLIGAGKSIRGSIEGDSDPHEFIPTMLGWMREGKFPVGEIISTFPFEKINDAVDAAHGSTVKAILEF